MKKSSPLHIRFEMDQLFALRDIARHTNKNVSEVVREIVTEQLLRPDSLDYYMGSIK